MTKDEIQYLEDLKGLDDIHLGMALPSAAVKRPTEIRDRLLKRGWIWVSGKKAFGEPIVFLGTHGLRALNRAHARQGQQQ